MILGCLVFGDWPVADDTDRMLYRSPRTGLFTLYADGSPHAHCRPFNSWRRRGALSFLIVDGKAILEQGLLLGAERRKLDRSCVLSTFESFKSRIVTAYVHRLIGKAERRHLKRG